MNTGGDRVRTAPWGVEERLAELVPSLLDRLEEMTDRMVEILVETEPAYREAMAGNDPQMRATLRRNLEVGVRGLLSDVPAAYHQSHAEGARAVGRRRAAQGIPLEAVLRAYRLGGQVTWEALLRVSAQAGGRHDTLLLQLAGTVWRTNDGECA